MADLGAEVANALHWDLAIPRHRITAEVDAGVVTLRGIVDRTYQRSCAEAVARRVSGVTGVNNKIAVRAAEDLGRPSLHH
jgi:osmotically-inducible protein OsmY